MDNHKWGDALAVGRTEITPHSVLVAGVAGRRSGTRISAGQ